MYQAIRRGLSDAIRFPAPLMILFVIYLAAALIVTLPIFSALNQTYNLSRRLASDDMARTFDVMTLVESSMFSGPAVVVSSSSEGTPTPSQPEPTGVMSSPLVMLLPVTLGLAALASLPNALISGGALQVYADGRFTWRRFLWGGWHWALPFVVLLVVFSLVATLIVLLGLVVAVVILAVGANVLLLPGLIPVVALYFVMAGLFDYARAIAVSERRRNIFWALWRSLRFTFRQPLRAFGLYLALILLGYLLIVVYNRIASPLIPFGWALVAIGLQQVFVAAQLWARLARWASTLALYRGQKDYGQTNLLS